MIKYRTIRREGSAEIAIKKSRFIARICPVHTRDEAGALFSEVRRLHHSARHNVPVYIIGDKTREEWSSEDGEPQGTAGAPMLQLLVSENITNVALIVTRYFGGIKLGTGGLARAYTAAAKAALRGAGTCDVHAGIRLKYEMGYQTFEKLRIIAYRDGYTIEGAEYGEDVNFWLCGAIEQKEKMIKAVSLAEGLDKSPVSIEEADVILS